MLRSFFLAAVTSLTLLMSVNTSDAQMFWGGRWRGGYYQPSYRFYRPYAVPVYPSYYYGYYGPSYYPGTSYYSWTPNMFGG